MRRSRLLWEVTRWEFSRWFKIRDQIITLIVILVSGLLFWGGRQLLKRVDQPGTVALINQSPIQVTAPNDIVFAAATPDEREVLEAQVQAGDLDGLVILDEDANATLIVRRTPVFQNQLQLALNQAQQDYRLSTSGMSKTALVDIFAPVDLGIVYTQNHKRATKADLLITGVINGLILLALFFCLSYQFAAITGEKQSRITEQIIAAVPPQVWIDGKILGVSLLALVSMATYCLGIGLFLLSAQWFGNAIPIDWRLGHPFATLLILVYALGGFLMWNACFAGIAATINDPNTSSKSSLMFLPMLTLGFGFLALKRPDTTMMQIFSILPFTAPSVMPVRLLIGDPSFWQIALSLGLLAATAWLFRRLAGAVFGLGMLMYGKEPTLKEVMRWIRPQKQKGN